MSFSRFDHQQDSYDPTPELTPREAADFLNGIKTEATTPETDVRSISPETVHKMQDALRNLQILPDQPTEQ